MILFLWMGGAIALFLYGCAALAWGLFRMVFWGALIFAKVAVIGIIALVAMASEIVRDAQRRRRLT